MKKTFFLISILSLLYILSACASSPVINITAGGTGGTSYKVAKATGDVLSDTMTDVIIKTAPGYGAYAGCEAVEAGRADVAVVQSDVAYLAYTGTDVFTDQPCENIRGIAAMYPSAVQLITLTGSGIKSIDDLYGKRVAVGALSSRNYQNVLHVLSAYQFSINQLTPFYYSLDQAVLAMENDEIDALFFTGGYPNTSIVKLTQTQNIRVVNTVRLPESVKLIAALDAEIYAISDLAGKKVSMGEEDNVLYPDIINLIEAYELDPERIEQMNMTFAEAIAAIKTGNLDAVFVSENDPDYNFDEIAVNEDITNVPIDYTLLGNLEQIVYYSAVLMPENTYQGMDKRVAATTTMSMMICNAEMDDEAVYQLTKQFWENAEAIRAKSGIDYDLLIENAMEGMGIPLHPGAQKYYDEMAKSDQ